MKRTSWVPAGWRDAVAGRVASLLPRRVVYWALIRAGTGSIEGDEVVPEVPYLTVLQRFHRKAGL